MYLNQYNKIHVCRLHSKGNPVMCITADPVMFLQSRVSFSVKKEIKLLQCNNLRAYQGERQIDFEQVTLYNLYSEWVRVELAGC